MDEFARIRLAHRDGLSNRKIARTYGHSRHTVHKILDESTPKPYTLRRPRSNAFLAPPVCRISYRIVGRRSKLPRSSGSKSASEKQDSTGSSMASQCCRPNFGSNLVFICAVVVGSLAVIACASIRRRRPSDS